MPDHKVHVLSNIMHYGFLPTLAYSTHNLQKLVFWVICFNFEGKFQKFDSLEWAEKLKSAIKVFLFEKSETKMEIFEAIKNLLYKSGTTSEKEIIQLV